MGHIHAADPARSKRLRAVLDFLIKRGVEGATTREIIKVCEVCAVNAIVPELRARGYQITCKTKIDPVTGGRVARYTLIQAVPVAQEGVVQE